MEPNDGEVNVPRQVDQIDLLIEQVTRVSTTVEDLILHQKAGNNQTIVHKTDGVGGVMGACLATAVTACVFTFLALILFAGEVRKTQRTTADEIRDLKAWGQINQNKITTLEALHRQSQQTKENGK